MTFDEEINKYKNLSYQYYGLYPIYTNEDVHKLIEKLKQEYAPTVDMTREQQELFLLYKENTWFSIFIGKLNDPDNPVYNSLPSLLAFDDWGFEKERENQLMQAWLNPEAIKLVER